MHLTVFFFFFFQAEDGIRDSSVTGVQTCALPILIDGKAGFTVSDYTYIGKAQPKLTYGINNLITYKNLELSFFLRGVMGNDVLNFSKMSYANIQWLPGANVLNTALTMGFKQSPFYN